MTDLANSFISEIFSFNHDVLKCYNLAFDPKIKDSFIDSNSFKANIYFNIFFGEKIKAYKKLYASIWAFDPRIDIQIVVTKPKKIWKKITVIRAEIPYDLLNLKKDINRNLPEKEREINLKNNINLINIKYWFNYIQKLL